MKKQRIVHSCCFTIVNTGYLENNLKYLRTQVWCEWTSYTILKCKEQIGTNYFSSEPPLKLTLGEMLNRANRSPLRSPHPFTSIGIPKGESERMPCFNDQQFSLCSSLRIVSKRSVMNQWQQSSSCNLLLKVQVLKFTHRNLWS